MLVAVGACRKFSMHSKPRAHVSLGHRRKTARVGARPTTIRTAILQYTSWLKNRRDPLQPCMMLSDF